ncbi:MAG: 30S ribosomal protein S9 [Candidatus Aenigmarchaeota archaeon]|nr:30S ribosomal protein S9 [Candidatus Aenigmarchaeota archaeon]
MKRIKPVTGPVFTSGKRKRAIARARMSPGKGTVRINDQLLEVMRNELVRLRIQEPLVLAGETWKGQDIHVHVQGGGIMGQADAARQAIARGLVLLYPDLKERFLAYDRFLIAHDPRRTETHKPPRSSQGARRGKQKSKR